MIPTFPEFKKIEISDKEEIENFTKDFPPYSDFNFISLFCWDVDNKRQVSFLNGNLVVRLTDDISGKEFLSFLGNKKVPETIDELLWFARRQSIKTTLRMIPQEAVNYCSNPELSLNIKEDRNSFDYVFNLDDLSNLCGNKYENVRKHVNRFQRNYEERSEVVVFNELNDGKYIDCIRSVWKEWKSLKESYSSVEERAISKLFDNAEHFSMKNILLFIDGKPAAFSLNQVIDKENAISHFAKVNYNYGDIFPFLQRETAKCLAAEGCKFVNLEEDLGLLSLRKAKEQYRPSNFLRKYTIERRKGIIGKLLAIFH